MRKKLNRKHILDICEKGDYGILPPPMKAQTAVNELCCYFLGDDWYSTSGATDIEQINTEVVAEIEKRYRGAKVTFTEYLSRYKRKSRKQNKEEL